MVSLSEMKVRKPLPTDTSAQEKIKEAARELFTQHGFDTVKTRDIARESGINMALIHYYFGSKENLFSIVMTENMQHFMEGVMLIADDRKTSVEEKMNLLVNNYIDMLIRNPHIPLFILNEIRNNPSRLFKANKLRNLYLVKQLRDTLKSGQGKQASPLHLLMNILGLTIFPFVARPIIQQAGSVTQEEFIKMMDERRELIPKWINAMLKVK